MSGTIRIWLFVGVLAATVVAALSVVAAQAPAPPELPRGERRDLMWLDGRGSRLGVMVQDLDPASGGSGVRVDSVDPESPAEKAGIKAGDIVIEYDGERVRSARQFTRLVQETPEGRQIPLAVMREGTRQALTATPEARGFAWNMRIDGDEIRREVERGMRAMPELRLDEPPMRFRFDRGLGMPIPGRRRLGVSVDSMSDQLAQYFGATDGGALVTSVDRDSAAEKAGLKAGDVITSINGGRVRDADQLLEAMRDIRDGDVTIGYLRDRKAGTATATIQAPSAGSTRQGEPRRPVRPAAYMRPA